MGSHNICSKTDRALVAYLVSIGVPGNIWPAKRSLDKALPFTNCFSHTANPPQEDPYSGNRIVEAFVEVRSSGVIEENQPEDQPRISDDDLVSAVFDAFSVGEDQCQDSTQLAAAITAAARASGAPGDVDLQNFTCQSCKVVGETQGFNPRTIIQQGDAWVNAIHLEMLCSPSNVS